MVLENVNVKTGVANGSLATITEFLYDPQGSLSGILVKLSETSEVRCIRRSN